MWDKGSQTSLQLQRMPHGGFVVSDGRLAGSDGYLTQHHFASTSIDEALKFMRDAINPVSATVGIIHKDHAAGLSAAGITPDWMR